LPLRAAAHPPINWGDPRGWAGFWWVISGSPYRELAFGLPKAFLYGRVEAWAALLAQQFGWLGIGLGLVGLLYGAAGTRLFIWPACGLAIAFSAFALTYDTVDSYTYLLPTYIVFAIWIGLGVHVVLETLANRRPVAAPLAATALTIALLWRVPVTALQVDASHDRQAIDFATQVLAAAPPRAIVVTQADRDTFALWYYHYALGDRPDLFVIAEPLLEFMWYRDTLYATYPTLHLPEPSGAEWTTALAAANPQRGPICRTRLDITPPLTCDAP
jgi:hypothetical protein